MGLARVSKQEIEDRLALVVHCQALAREADRFAELLVLEGREESLWSAWHRARANDGYARV